MNCETCKNPMVWEGKMSSGKMVCKTCEALDYSQYIVEELTAPELAPNTDPKIVIDPKQFITVWCGNYKNFVICQACKCCMVVLITDTHAQCPKCKTIGEIEK